MPEIPFPFNIDNITSAINREPNLYNRAGELIGFDPRPQASIAATLAYQDDEVVLLDPVERSGPNQQMNRERTDAITFNIPSYKDEDLLSPEDIQNITAFQPGPKQLEMQAAAYSRRLRKIRKPFDLTFEYLRFKAIQGIVAHPRRDDLYNLFNEFGIQKKVVGFDLSNPNADIRGACRDMVDHIADNLRGEISNGVHCFVSSDFFHALDSHPNYEKYLQGHAAALGQLESRRGDTSSPNPKRRIVIGDVTFESYTANGKNGDGETVKFLEDGQGNAFPTGTLEAFQEYDAPPNRMNAVNMAPSDEIHIYTEELGKEKGIEIEGEACKLCICARPELLIEVTADA